MCSSDLISAVGHETDWTICDFVADLRAPTPSAAAELVSAARDELLQRIKELTQRLERAWDVRLRFFLQQLSGLQRALHDPSRLIGHIQQRVDDLSERLDSAVHNQITRYLERLARAEQQLSLLHPLLQIGRIRQQLALLSEQAERRVVSLVDHLAREHGEATARLQSLSPLQTLARGYAVVEQLPGRQVVKNVMSLRAGDEVTIRLHQGRILCTVEETYSDSGVKATT